MFFANRCDETNSCCLKLISLTQIKCKIFAQLQFELTYGEEITWAWEDQHKRMDCTSRDRNINKIIIFKAFIYSTYIAVQSFNINKLFIKWYTVLIYIYIYIYVYIL